MTLPVFTGKNHSATPAGPRTEPDPLAGNYSVQVAPACFGSEISKQTFPACEGKKQSAARRYLGLSRIRSMAHPFCSHPVGFSAGYQFMMPVS